MGRTDRCIVEYVGSYMVLVGGTMLNLPAFAQWRAMEAQDRVDWLCCSTTMAGPLTIDDYDIARGNVKDVCILASDTAGATGIGDGFLYQFENLETLVFDFDGVESTGDGFLQGCSSIQGVLTLRMENVTSIGDSFLAECTSLGGVVLNMPELTNTGWFFLEKARSIKTVDMKNTQVASFPFGFMNIVPRSFAVLRD